MEKFFSHPLTMADESSSTTAVAALTAAAAEMTSQPTNSDDVSIPAAAAATTIATTSTNNANIEFEPPAACIRRLLKQCLPKSTNVSKDSLSAISRASGIFVLYLTSCANDVAREGKRTTIIAKDVLGALKELDFEEFIPCMDAFLEGYRREEKNKKEEKEAMKVKRFQQQQQMQQQPGRDGTTGKFIAKEEDDDHDADNVGDANADKGGDKTQEEGVTNGNMKHARDEDDDVTWKEGEEPLAKKTKESRGETEKVSDL